MNYITMDKITCITACNALQEQHVKAIIELLETGKTPDKFSYVDEGMYAHDDTVKSVTVDGIEYPVTVVTAEELENCEY